MLTTKDIDEKLEDALSLADATGKWEKPKERLKSLIKQIAEESQPSFKVIIKETINSKNLLTINKELISDDPWCNDYNKAVSDYKDNLLRLLK